MVVPPTDLSVYAQKTDLRKHLKKIRKEFVLKQNSSQIAGKICYEILSFVSRSDVIAGYAALVGEPDVFPMLASLRERVRMTSLPAIDEPSEAMIFRAWQAGEPLQQSAFGFLQPLEKAKAVTPDLILVPLVGFDAAFNRLGHGAGHFDRALAERPQAIAVGVAWSVQEVVALPVDPWDVPLDAILTEREWRVSPTGKLAQ